MTHGPCRSAASCSRTSAPPPASQSAGAGQLFGRLAPACRLQRLIRRPGRALGGRLSAALEHHRLERSAALEGLHPAHAGRSRFPYPERSARRASDLASARGSRPGPHPRVLPRLRVWKSLEMWQQRAGLGCAGRCLSAPLLITARPRRSAASSPQPGAGFGNSSMRLAPEPKWRFPASRRARS
jgi:hypothetical protein